MKKAVLCAGGAFNLLLALFHMMFWKALHWAEELPKLSRDNAAIMQVANIIIIFMLLYFAFMSFMMARRGTGDFYSKSIILCIMGFYSIRLIAGYPFFGYSAEELVIWILCLAVIAAYGSVLAGKKTPAGGEHERF
jgi:hypothetical protein